ncbi:2,3-diaminopropionate biosynthesis protein SbnB [Paucibacter sp. APW11]|uniref:2,3-diaminopropionate biosynthesis protein SbnB n=1 Tax=Roseateles aquae TaxID=3077235 RepID=A0ABU3PHU4_9BURK|nr:2,3-diaminopropionate biosynthesis protein SbnB [Paucibacter sp. APW11]MDT9002103.1 2,3-diaminopropionate biosynthesis protein SbnB [Paucibacter sp. APW11]
MFEFHVLTGSRLKQLLELHPARCIESVADAYLAHHHGKTVNPDSYFLRFPSEPQNRIIALPASIAGEQAVSGIKWIASYPGNVERGIPRASAVLVLNDPATGYPYALLEGALISAARTAASAVLAARWINAGRREAMSVSFIGAGVIARSIYDMFRADHWTFEQLIVHDHDAASSEAFAAYARKQSNSGVRVDSLDAALAADVVVFATNAGTPYVGADRPFAPGQIVLNVSLRDLAPELILAAANLFDDVEHCMKANTSPHLAEQLSGHRAFVTGTLAQLMLGEIELDRGKPVIFSPFGMGMLDLALGKQLFEAALAQGQAIAIPEFFGETSRW